MWFVRLKLGNVVLSFPSQHLRSKKRDCFMDRNSLLGRWVWTSYPPLPSTKFRILRDIMLMGLLAQHKHQHRAGCSLDPVYTQTIKTGFGNGWRCPRCYMAPLLSCRSRKKPLLNRLVWNMGIDNTRPTNFSEITVPVSNNTTVGTHEELFTMGNFSTTASIFPRWS